MINVVGAIKRIQTQVERISKKGCLPYMIEDIKKAIIDCGFVDEINISGLKIYSENGMTNPIKGIFERYREKMATYSQDNRDIANIHYQENLNYCWQRFVICKEMCHSFIDNKSSWVKDDESLLNLVEWLSVCPKRMFVIPMASGASVHHDQNPRQRSSATRKGFGPMDGHRSQGEAAWNRGQTLRTDTKAVSRT